MNDQRKKLNRTLAFTMIVGILMIGISFGGFYIGFQKFHQEIFLCLTYHGITNKPAHPWEIQWEKLNDTLDKLEKHGFKSISPTDFEKWWSGSISGGKYYLLTFDDGLVTSYRAIKKLKRKRNIDSIFFIVNDFIGKPGYITKEQIIELVSSYSCEIGLHGKRHYEITKILKEGSDLTNEIQTAKVELDKITGKISRFYAYPFGVYNSKSAACIASTSFRFGFTVDGTSILRTDAPNLLPRVMYLNGARAAGAPDPHDWTPPKSKSLGSLIITLSSLVMFIGISWILRSLNIYKTKQGNKKQSSL